MVGYWQRKLGLIGLQLIVYVAILWMLNSFVFEKIFILNSLIFNILFSLMSWLTALVFSKTKRK